MAPPNLRPFSGHLPMVVASSCKSFPRIIVFATIRDITCLRSEMDEDAPVGLSSVSVRCLVGRQLSLSLW